MADRADWRSDLAVDVPAVVFKLIKDPWQHGDVAVVRSLGRLGVPVYQATRVPGAPVVRSRYSRGHVLMPDPARSEDAVLTTLFDVADRLRARPILVPTDDVAALFVGDHPSLAEAFRLPAQPSGLPRRLSDKRQLHQLCLEAGVPSPEARFPTSRAEMRQQVEELGFPVVIKSMDPTLLRRRASAMSVAIATGLEEAMALYDTMEDPQEPNLMLQEFIPGGATSIWMFNGYFDGSGECRIGFVGQKIRQAPPHTGATSLGVAVRNPTVNELARHFLREAGYRGIVDLGFRFDARDQRYKLLDVNPRIGSSFRLFVGRNGLDVARTLYLDLTDQPIPSSEIRRGRRWWVEDQDAATCLGLLRAGELSVRELVSSFRGVEEAAWICRDDMAPALALFREIARHLIARGVRR
ncbi:MAG: carboxylate--amine ligase, partial [Candidatus Limnocylindria bacterium]